jgi:hypothetical protein
MRLPAISKEAARYTNAGGREHCSLCRHFSPRRGGRCARVLGDISPMGWCRLFSREMRGLVADASSFNGGGGPSLGLDFMTPGVLDPRITFTRASTATYFDSAGVMQTTAVNAPRWDYDPATLALRGLLIEEARTNLLLNSATLGTQSVTVTAVAHTLSFYGTGTITRSGVSTGALVGTGATQRVSVTFTPTAGSLTCTVTGSVTNAQLEIGSNATSYIPTTGTTAARAADLCNLTPLGSWFSTGAGSFLCEFDATRAGGIPGGFSSGAFANVIYLSLSANGAASSIASVSVSQGSTVVSTAGIVQKMAVAYGSGRLAVCNNGLAVATNATLAAGPYPWTLNMSFGSAPWSVGTNAICGHMRRAAYWSSALPDATLQQLTAL